MARKSRKNMMPQAAVQEAVQQNEKELLRTAAYARLSVENGGHETEDSLHTQILQIHNYIRENPELTLTDTYADNGFTGTRFDRPEFERMMQDVRTGKIQCIVVKDLSRFGRDYIETGNYLETIFPMLLLDYICSQRVKHGKMPADPVMVKTIVTMDMGEQIATHYGLRTINVLTGFKFIGEQIGKLEQEGRADSYVFGFEESDGYLTGSYVRDKDGVDGAYMICEMFSYYATKGISLLDKLEELYKTYGYCLNTLHSYEFDGSAGFAKMQRIMQAFRGGIKEFGGKKVVKLLDYAPGLDGLPKSDVLKFLLEDNCSIVVRPSGTEPKLKTYISISAENKETAEKIEAEICKSAEEYLK